MQPWLQVAEPWQEASVEINTNPCGAPRLPLEKDKLGLGIKARKDNCKDPNPPARRKVSGAGAGEHVAFSRWLSCAALRGVRVHVGGKEGRKRTGKGRCPRVTPVLSSDTRPFHPSLVIVVWQTAAKTTLFNFCSKTRSPCSFQAYPSTPAPSLFGKTHSLW